MANKNGIPQVFHKQNGMNKTKKMNTLDEVFQFSTGEVYRAKKISPRNWPLQNEQLMKYKHGFMEWRKILNNNKANQYREEGTLHQFLIYLDTMKITNLESLTVDQVRKFIGYLQVRPNTRRGGSLSISYINSFIRLLNLFFKYLRKSLRIGIYIYLKPLKNKVPTVSVLNYEEIQSLYDATKQNAVLWQRDTVMLHLYYGCGLRRSEGENINLDDIDLKNRRLLVRSGKGSKMRYVPFTERVTEDIKEYIADSRPLLLRKENQTALLLPARRNNERLAGGSAYFRLCHLCKLSKSPTLKNKQVGLHTLRHSIATHLLHSGMPIEKVAKFLGHSSILTTQVYTHLAHEL